jgi:hypothetical protein
MLRLSAPRLWRRHGDELESMARERLDAAGQRGRLARWGAEVALALDAVGQLPSLHGGLMHDLRNAVRSLAGSPGFALAAILSIALAV